MSGRLQGKVAVVTGSSKGLGAAIARSFGAEGASVIVNYSSSQAAAEEVVSGIVEAGGVAAAVKADMREPEKVEQLFAEANRTYGKIDVLVNNAGIYDFQPLENISIELFRKHMELNVFGYLLAIKEVVKYMPDGGSIVNMGSTVTVFGATNSSVYSASKGAIDALTRSLSTELGPRKIRVNAIKAGVVDTEGLQAGGFLETDFGPTIIADTPLRQLGVPDDIAPAAVYLASDESSWTTGEYFTLAGGHR